MSVSGQTGISRSKIIDLFVLWVAVIRFKLDSIIIFFFFFFFSFLKENFSNHLLILRNL